MHFRVSDVPLSINVWGRREDQLTFEPLHLKLIDRQGNQVSESVRTTVVRAFERALKVPDADIDDLVLGAARVARVISDGDADQPVGYSSSVLDRIAWQSQQDLLHPPNTSQLRNKHIRALAAAFSERSSVLAELEIDEILQRVNERDQQIIIMRSRGFRYEDIARELGMLVVTVRCRFHLARKRLRQVAVDE